MSAQQLGLFAAPNSGADISPCGRYRFRLWRSWAAGDGTCVFCMLNPSKADATIDDPTCARCTAFAKRWGFAGVVLVNLCAWRATDPKDLEQEHERGTDVVGPGNVEIVLAEVKQARRVVVAWGGSCKLVEVYAPPMLRRFADTGIVVHHLGLTDAGHPKHPQARGRHRVPDDVEPRRLEHGQRAELRAYVCPACGATSDATAPGACRACSTLTVLAAHGPDGPAPERP